MHKIGNRYQYTNGTKYILAACKPIEAILINLATGGFWGSPTIVEDCSHITDEEFAEITDGHSDDFTLIEVKK